MSQINLGIVLCRCSEQHQTVKYDSDSPLKYSKKLNKTETLLLTQLVFLLSSRRELMKVDHDGACCDCSCHVSRNSEQPVVP